MRIGLISDTHGKLPAEVYKLFENIDHIIHAGDIGSREVIIELQTIAPVSAVHGNVDNWEISSMYPAAISAVFQNRRFYITHIVENYKTFSYLLFKKHIQTDFVIHGHTHRPTVEYYRDIMFINPGCIYGPRGGNKSTIAVLDVSQTPASPIFLPL